MYLDAMKKSDASLEQINSFLNHIMHGTDIFLVIAVSDIPESVKEFLRFTFEIIAEGKPHKIVDVSEIPTDRTFRNAWTYVDEDSLVNE